MSYVIRVSIPQVFASQLHTETLPNQESNLGKVPSQMEQAVHVTAVSWQGLPSLTVLSLLRKPPIFWRKNLLGNIWEVGIFWTKSEILGNLGKILGNLGKSWEVGMKWNEHPSCLLFFVAKSTITDVSPRAVRAPTAVVLDARLREWGHPENDRGKDVNWNTQFIIVYSWRWDSSWLMKVRLLN